MVIIFSLDNDDNKQYRGWRSESGKPYVTVNEIELPLVDYISSQPFDWGTDSAGATNLALSILADYFGEWWANGNYIRSMKANDYAPKCWAYYQSFKRGFVVKWQTAPNKSWTISSLTIATFLALDGWPNFTLPTKEL